MFATSTKTATFFPTNDSLVIPCPRRRRGDAARRAGSLGPAYGGPDRGHLPFRPRTTFGKPVTFPAGPRRRVLWQRRFNDTAALVACRTKDLFDEGIGDAFHIVVGIHHEEVYCPHESA